MSMRLALFSLAALLSACQPTPGAVIDVDGKAKFKVEDAIFVPLMVDGRIVGGDLVIADQPDLCATVRSGTMPSRMKALTFRLARLTEGSYFAPDVGDYSIIDRAPSAAGNFALAELLESDLNCTQTLSEFESTLNTGSVEIRSLDPSEGGLVRGEFLAHRQTTIGSQWLISNTVKGRFAAEYCHAGAQKLSCR